MWGEKLNLLKIFFFYFFFVEKKQLLLLLLFILWRKQASISLNVGVAVCGNMNFLKYIHRYFGCVLQSGINVPRCPMNRLIWPASDWFIPVQVCICFGQVRVTVSREYCFRWSVIINETILSYCSCSWCEFSLLMCLNCKYKHRNRTSVPRDVQRRPVNEIKTSVCTKTYCGINHSKALNCRWG